MSWLEHEHFAYQIQKFPASVDDTQTRIDPSQWEGDILKYLHRALVLGLDNPLGRQAIAKMAATAVGMAESVVRLYGELPEPGVPSGENADKLWPTT